MQENGKFVLIISTILILIIVIALVILFTTFQKKKNTLVEERKKTKEKFDREITETQIEIREQTLRNISWELHDNIGQLLTLAKIQIQNQSPESIKEVTVTISKSLEEIRTLSKLINPDIVKNIRLKNAIQLEVDRFNRLDFIKSTLKITGEEVEIDSKAETVIFRILQEFLSNTIKHSRASNLDISLHYSREKLEINITDNGVGFDVKKPSKETGIGLQNIKNRAKLIGATLDFSSEEQKGTQMKISYNIQEK